VPEQEKDLGSCGSPISTSPPRSRLGEPSPYDLLITDWRVNAERERNDRWNNTADAPIWRSIHALRAEVWDACADALAAAVKADNGKPSQDLEDFFAVSRDFFSKMGVR
jgi:hypothetical protein